MWTPLNMGSYGRKRLSRLMWTELRFPWTDFLEKITRDPKMSLVYQDFFSKACDYFSTFGKTLIWGFMGKGIVESMKWTSTYEFHVESVCWGVWDAECTVMLLLLAASFILGQWKSNGSDTLKVPSGRQTKRNFFLERKWRWDGFPLGQNGDIWAIVPFGVKARDGVWWISGGTMHQHLTECANAHYHFSLLKRNKEKVPSIVWSLN